MSTANNVNISIRSFNPGEENQIVDLLNKSFGQWGDLQQWEWKHSEFPAFEDNNIIIAEVDGSIVGHRGLIFRDVLLPSGEKIFTASIGDTAVHPDYRKLGIYKIMHDATMIRAKSKNAHIIFSWNSHGSATYWNNIKTGFIDQGEYVYVKVLNPRKFIQLKFDNLISNNTKLSRVIRCLGSYIYITTKDETFCIINTIVDSRRPDKSNRVEIYLGQDAFNMLVNLEKKNKIYKVFYSFYLLLSRNLKVKIVILRAKS